MLQWQFGNNAVDCSSHTDAVIDFFAVYTAAMTRNVFQSAGQPHKLPLPLGGSRLPSNTQFLEPTQVYPANDILISSAIFAGLTKVTNRQTDTQTDMLLHP